MSSNLSPEKKAVVQVVTWTFSIVTILTAINLFFIVNSIGPGIKIPFQRDVASLPNTQLFLEDFVSPVFELDCSNLKQKMFLKTKAPTTRISFKHCEDIGRIENKSNKNQGDVFALADKKWTSDFIFLSPGKNHLNIPTNGKVYTVEITRELLKKQAEKKAL